MGANTHLKTSPSVYMYSQVPLNLSCLNSLWKLHMLQIFPTINAQHPCEFLILYLYVPSLLRWKSFISDLSPGLLFRCLHSRDISWSPQQKWVFLSLNFMSPLNVGPYKEEFFFVKGKHYRSLQQSSASPNLNYSKWTLTATKLHTILNKLHKGINLQE